MGWLFSFCEVLCCTELCLLSCPGSSGGRAHCLESGGLNSTPGCCFCQWGTLNRVWCDGCVFHLVMHLQTCDFLTELFLITDIHWNRIETTSMSLASDIAQSSPQFAVCHFQLAKIPACNQLIRVGVVNSTRVYTMYFYHTKTSQSVLTFWGRDEIFASRNVCRHSHWQMHRLLSVAEVLLHSG